MSNGGKSVGDDKRRIATSDLARAIVTFSCAPKFKGAQVRRLNITSFSNEHWPDLKPSLTTQELQREAGRHSQRELARGLEDAWEEMSRQSEYADRFTEANWAEISRTYISDRGPTPLDPDPPPDEESVLPCTDREQEAGAPVGWAAWESDLVDPPLASGACYVPLMRGQGNEPAVTADQALAAWRSEPLPWRALVLAGAGFGKTTLARWIMTRHERAWMIRLRELPDRGPSALARLLDGRASGREVLPDLIVLDGLDELRWEPQQLQAVLAPRFARLPHLLATCRDGYDGLVSAALPDANRWRRCQVAPLEGDALRKFVNDVWGAEASTIQARIESAAQHQRWHDILCRPLGVLVAGVAIREGGGGRFEPEHMFDQLSDTLLRGLSDDVRGRARACLRRVALEVIQRAERDAFSFTREEWERIVADKAGGGDAPVAEGLWSSALLTSVPSPRRRGIALLPLWEHQAACFLKELLGKEISDETCQIVRDLVSKPTRHGVLREAARLCCPEPGTRSPALDALLSIIAGVSADGATTASARAPVLLLEDLMPRLGQPQLGAETLAAMSRAAHQLIERHPDPGGVPRGVAIAEAIQDDLDRAGAVLSYVGKQLQSAEVERAIACKEVLVGWIQSEAASLEARSVPPAFHRQQLRNRARAPRYLRLSTTYHRRFPDCRPPRAV